MKQRKYRVKTGKYYQIYKPHFKYSYSNGRIPEHRYIYYIYLSILNGKVTYIPKNMDINHKNKNPKDNNISNLELLTKKEHKTTDMSYYTSNRICNLCKKESSKNKYRDKHWLKDINGFLCHYCYMVIYRYKQKFSIL